MSFVTEPNDLEAERALAFFDLEMADLAIGVDLVRSLVLADDTGREVVVTDDDAGTVFPRLAFHRMLPQLAAAVAAGRVIIGHGLRTDLDRMLVSLAVQDLKLEQLLVRTGEVLRDVNVEFRVLKGLATSRLDHHGSERRTTVDVDLLVPPPELARAIKAFVDAGFERRYEIESLMDKGETLVDTTGWCVDLHTRLHSPARSLPDDFWALSERFEVNGISFDAMCRGARLGHAASHLALSWPSARRFSSLLDLVVLADLATAEDRWIAERMLRDTGVSDIVNRVTRRAACVVGRSDLVLGASGSHHLLDLLLRRAYDRSDDHLVAMKAATIYGMPARERLDVLENWVHPSAEYLARGGYSSRRDRVRKVVRRVGGSRGQGRQSELDRD